MFLRWWALFATVSSFYLFYEKQQHVSLIENSLIERNALRQRLDSIELSHEFCQQQLLIQQNSDRNNVLKLSGNLNSLYQSEETITNLQKWNTPPPYISKRGETIKKSVPLSKVHKNDQNEYVSPSTNFHNKIRNEQDIDVDEIAIKDEAKRAANKMFENLLSNHIPQTVNQMDQPAYSQISHQKNKVPNLLNEIKDAKEEADGQGENMISPQKQDVKKIMDNNRATIELRNSIPHMNELGMTVPVDAWKQKNGQNNNKKTIQFQSLTNRVSSIITSVSTTVETTTTKIVPIYRSDEVKTVDDISETVVQEKLAECCDQPPPLKDDEQPMKDAEPVSLEQSSIDVVIEEEVVGVQESLEEMRQAAARRRAAKRADLLSKQPLSLEKYDDKEEYEEQQMVIETGVQESLKEMRQAAARRRAAKRADLLSKHLLSSGTQMNEHDDEFDENDDVPDGSSERDDMVVRKNSTLVVDFTPVTFEAALDHYDFVFVDFYAPWCDHCRQLLTELDEAAKLVAPESNSIAVGTVDCMVHTKLCSEIDSVPKLWLFRNRNSVLEGTTSIHRFIEYVGPRTAIEIKKWILGSSYILTYMQHGKDQKQTQTSSSSSFSSTSSNFGSWSSWSHYNGKPLYPLPQGTSRGLLATNSPTIDERAEILSVNPPIEISVCFWNLCDEEIGLHWLNHEILDNGKTGSPALTQVRLIDTSEEVEMLTYTGHTFFVVSNGGHGTRLLRFTILPHIHRYVAMFCTEAMNEVIAYE